MQIKSFCPRLRKQLAFTMIELLIVIAILGILAVAVLSAINPIEQINRGRDTGLRSDAEQLISAIDRYYAMKGLYPWQNNPVDDVAVDWTAVDLDLADVNGCPVLYRISDNVDADLCGDEVGTQELKISFVTKVTAANYNRLKIYHRGGNSDSTYVCFTPMSNSFQQEALERVEDPDLLPVDYPADAIANTTAGELGCGTEGNCVCLP